MLIQQVQSALYAERLAARSAGFTGFHHDLANRLFLFKSIPQLAGFSSPEELFEDLNGELPTLIHFLENRLNKSWIGDEPLETVSDLSSLNAVMTEWLNDPLIKRYLQFHIEDGLNIPRFPCTGLFWSITQLVLRLKRGELPHLAASSHIALKISTAPDLPLGTVGAAGFLSPSSPTLQVTLSIEGMNSGEWARAWRDGLGWDFSSRSARLKSPAPREAAACWFGSWVNAAHQVNGIIVTRDHDLDIIF